MKNSDVAQIINNLELHLKNKPTSFKCEDVELELTEQIVCEMVEHYVNKNLSLESKERFYLSFAQEKPTIEEFEKSLFQAVINEVIREALIDLIEKSKI